VLEEKPVVRLVEPEHVIDAFKVTGWCLLRELRASFRDEFPLIVLNM